MFLFPNALNVPVIVAVKVAVPAPVIVGVKLAKVLLFSPSVVDVVLKLKSPVLPLGLQLRGFLFIYKTSPPDLVIVPVQEGVFKSLITPGWPDTVNPVNPAAKVNPAVVASVVSVTVFETYCFIWKVELTPVSNAVDK